MPGGEIFIPLYIIVAPGVRVAAAKVGKSRPKKRRKESRQCTVTTVKGVERPLDPGERCTCESTKQDKRMVTMEDWYAPPTVFCDIAKPGDLVEEKIVDCFMNAVPAGRSRTGLFASRRAQQLSAIPRH